MKKIFILIGLLGLGAACSQSDKLEIATTPTSQEGEWIDSRDDIHYKTVKVNGLEWMTENFRYRLELGATDGCATYKAAFVDTSGITDVRNVDRPLFLKSIIARYPNIEKKTAGVYEHPWGQAFFDFKSNYRFEVNHKRMMAFKAAVNKQTSDYVENIKMYQGYIETYPDYAQLYKDMIAQAQSDMLIFPKLVSAMEAVMNSTSALKNPVIAEQVLQSFNSEYYNQYGCLYSMASLSKVVPDGWRVPTDEDWKNLESALGMSPETCDVMNDWRGSTQADLLTATGEGTLGFGVDYGGAYLPGSFGGQGKWTNYLYLGYRTTFWSSTTINDGVNNYVVTRTFAKSNSKIYRGTSETRVNMFSLRLVRDVKTEKL